MDTQEAETPPRLATAEPQEPSDGLDTFLRIARVKQITDSSKATIRRWIKVGKFPRPCLVDGNTVLWSRREIEQWQRDKLIRRDEREKGKA